MTIEDQADEYERKWLVATYGCEFVKNEKGEWTPLYDESKVNGTDCRLGGGCE